MNRRSQSRPGQRLRDERLSHNWSQQELADQLGTTPVTVSRWENGVSAPSPYFRLKLEKLFGKSLEMLDLLPEEETMAEDEQSTQDESIHTDAALQANELAAPEQPSP